MDDGNMLKLEVLNLNLDTFRYTKRRGVAGANPEFKKNTFTLISPKNRPGVERLALVTPASFFATSRRALVLCKDFAVLLWVLL